MTAAQTIKKSVVCLATNAVSVLQWKFQFQLWTGVPEDRIAVFTSDRKDTIHPDACVVITTYTSKEKIWTREKSMRHLSCFLNILAHMYSTPFTLIFFSGGLPR